MCNASYCVLCSSQSHVYWDNLPGDVSTCPLWTRLLRLCICLSLLISSPMTDTQMAPTASTTMSTALKVAMHVPSRTMWEYLWGIYAGGGWAPVRRALNSDKHCQTAPQNEQESASHPVHDECSLLLRPLQITSKKEIPNFCLVFYFHNCVF